MRNIFRRLSARHRTFLVSCAVVVAAFQVVVCAIVSSIDIGTAVEQILAFAPPALRPLIEQSMAGSPQGMLAFAWSHPVTQALLAAVAITLAARAIAGEVEHGVIELILAQPITRLRYFTAHLTFGLAAITAVTLAGMLGTVAGRQLFSLAPLSVAHAWRLLVNVVLLQAAIYTATLLVSAFAREAGRAAIAGVMVAVVSYLIDVIAAMWSKAAFLLPYSLHHYYDPRQILTQGHLPPGAIPVLAAFVLVTGGTALLRFQRRDLP